MKRRDFLTVAAAGSLLLSPAVQAQRYVAGRHYLEIFPRVHTGQPEGQVQVVEVFWYGCPHCYRFQPVLGTWLQNRPDRTVFTHLPAPFNDLWALHARVFYAAQALNWLPQIHLPFFDAIHAQGRNLSSESAILRFVDQQGLDADAFRDRMRSEEVAAAVHDAGLLVQAYQLEGVPALVIDGRALLSPGMSGGYETMLQIASALIEEYSR